MLVRRYQVWDTQGSNQVNLTGVSVAASLQLGPQQVPCMSQSCQCASACMMAHVRPTLGRLVTLALDLFVHHANDRHLPFAIFLRAQRWFLPSDIHNVQLPASCSASA